MKRFFIKSVLFVVILCIGLSATYFMIHAWSGTDTLTATAGDKLTSAKRNNIVTKLNDLETKQTQYGKSWQYSSTANLSTTSTSWTDTDMVITATTISGHVLLAFDGAVWASAVGSYGFVFNIDGVDVITALWGNTHISSSETLYGKSTGATWIAPVSAGTHTFKVKRKTSAGTVYLGNSGNYSRQFQVIQLP